MFDATDATATSPATRTPCRRTWPQRTHHHTERPHHHTKGRHPTRHRITRQSRAACGRAIRGPGPVDDPDERRSAPHAIRQVHRAVAEATLVDELEVQTQIGRDGRRTGADRHGQEHQSELVHDTGAQRVGGELRSAHQQPVSWRTACASATPSSGIA